MVSDFIVFPNKRMIHMSFMITECVVIRDVTEQKKAEMDYQEKLRISALEAKQANDAKTDFLKRMSHDIRTPINGIRGMVTVGKSCIGDETKVEDCRIKLNAVQIYCWIL